ncbi:MAG: HD domain-containing protein [Lachnospiraceae bacterium]|nr:HD domain-containing protein [Lachnospiraceae bacterium]
MRYIEDLREGMNVAEIYFCKKADALVSKAGKTYYSVTLQDKTGMLDAKVWDVSNPGIEEFSTGDFVKVDGRVTSYQGKLQLNIDRIYQVQEGQYVLADYIPASEYDIEQMYSEMMAILNQVTEPHLKKLINHFFVEDSKFIESFKNHSAAKSVHHGFVGGLLEHTSHVVKVCNFMCSLYPDLNKDLLVTAAALHDIGKLKELSKFPTNEYTDCGQLLGHIVIGIMAVNKAVSEIEGFPVVLRDELLHCIASHHGELEFGSPKKPALMEAIALHHADNMDAKLETFKEAVKQQQGTEWSAYNRLLDTPIRRTTSKDKYK